MEMFQRRYKRRDYDGFNDLDNYHLTKRRFSEEMANQLAKLNLVTDSSPTTSPSSSRGASASTSPNSGYFSPPSFNFSPTKQREPKSPTQLPPPKALKFDDCDELIEESTPETSTELSTTETTKSVEADALDSTELNSSIITQTSAPLKLYPAVRLKPSASELDVIARKSKAANSGALILYKDTSAFLNEISKEALGLQCSMQRSDSATAQVDEGYSADVDIDTEKRRNYQQQRSIATSNSGRVDKESLSTTATECTDTISIDEQRDSSNTSSSSTSANSSAEDDTAEDMDVEL